MRRTSPDIHQTTKPALQAGWTAAPRSSWRVKARHCQIREINHAGRPLWNSVSDAIARSAHSSAQAADNAAIKEKADVCSGCHGENGISQTENIPSLAGQLDQFIQWQLVFFRAGSRKNEQMQPIVEQLTNEDIRNLGAYFAQMPPPKGAQGQQSGSVEEGRAGRRRPPLRLMPYGDTLRRH